MNKTIHKIAWPSAVPALTAFALIASLLGVSIMAAPALAAPGGPTVTLASTSDATTSSTSIPITATFSEAVGALDVDGIDVTNGTVTDLTRSGNTFSFNVHPISAGTVTVTVGADAVSSVGHPVKGNQPSNTLTFTYQVSTTDTTAPTIQREIISNPHGAVVTWTTNEPARGQINYGLSMSYGSSTPMETLFTTTHTATITGLTPDTMYHYEVTATDEAGNAGTTGDLTFVTPHDDYDDDDDVAPVISNVNATNIGSTTATINWTTDIGSNSQVLYGTTTALGSSTTVNSTFVTSHSVNLTGLTPNTLYHFKVVSAGNHGSTTSSDYTFTTTSGTSTPSAPVISNINVTGISSTTATVNWTTDVAANSRVLFGTTTDMSSATTLDPALVTNHSVTLTGLTPSTLYYFKVVSATGTHTTISDRHTFTTTSGTVNPPSPVVLAVTGIDSISTIASATNNFADGWKWIMHLTVPDNENAFRMKFADFTNGTGGTIPANGNIRISTAQGSNASTTSTGLISDDNNYGDWIFLTGDTSSTTPGRQIDVTIEVKIPVGTPTGTYSTTFGAQSVPSSSATSTTP